MDEPMTSPLGVVQEFKQFDVVTVDTDHHHLNSNRPKENGGGAFLSPVSGIHKKIMQEWKILDKHLPESIFVRVYESRIDLLRAVIVGAAGTPYHNGLFFFDLAFPPEYPTRPPKVYYHSFGLRLNPNLYANGSVCLSLINTWTGYQNEKWNPSSSTILQVLVSIQGLVLNEKPYFNEPGIQKLTTMAQAKKRSVAYNEVAFVLTCKTMLFLLRRPPKNFEPFVADHFRKQARMILRACQAYIKGRVSIGCYRDEESSSSSSSSKSNIKVSTTFTASMERIYPLLVEAFSKNGSSVENFVQQPEGPRSLPNKHGIKKMILWKVRKILGLQN